MNRFWLKFLWMLISWSKNYIIDYIWHDFYVIDKFRDIFFKTFWPNYILDISSYGQLLPLFVVNQKLCDKKMWSDDRKKRKFGNSPLLFDPTSYSHLISINTKNMITEQYITHTKAHISLLYQTVAFGKWDNFLCIDIHTLYSIGISLQKDCIAQFMLSTMIITFFFV